MTTDILVISADADRDINRLSESERSIVFNTLAEENSDWLSRGIVDSFAEQQTNLIRRQNRKNKPEISELLVRKIVDLSEYISVYYGLLVIPVVPDFRVKNAPDAKMGGVVARNVKTLRQIKQRRDENPRVIKTRFDRPVYAVTLDNTPYMIPPNEETDIVGVRVFQLCHPLVLNRDLYRLSLLDLHILGNYSFADFALHCRQFRNIHPVDGKDDTERIVKTDMSAGAGSTFLSRLFDTLSTVDDYLHSQQALAGVEHRLRHLPPISVQVNLSSVPTYTHAVDFSTTPSKSHAEFLKVLEGLTSRNFGNTYHLSTPFDIASSGLVDMYNTGHLDGKDSPAISKMIGQVKERQNQTAILRVIAAAQINAMYRYNLVSSIIEHKLGTMRYREIIRGDTTTDLLSRLKPAERKLVETELDRREKMLREMLSNKCPHVKLLREFRGMKFSPQSRKKFEQLQKYFAKDRHGESIKCNNCGFDIMCPHLVDYTHAIYRDATFNEMKIAMQKYISDVVTDSYFCKKCGEVLADVDVYGSIYTDEEANMSSTIDDDLRSAMMSEMYTAAKQVVFGPAVNVKKIVSSMMTSTYEYIFEAEKQLLKSKTNTADDVKNKKRLFITIYAYAYLIHIMMSNKSKDRNISIEFKGMKTASSPKDYVRHAILTIINTKNIIIRQMPNITNEFIYKKLIEAYQNIAQKGVVTMQLAGEMETIYNTLIIDPLYHYVYNMYTLDRKKFSRDAADIQAKIPEILSIENDNVKTDPFLGAKPLNPKRWNVAKFDDIQKGGGEGVYSAAFPGYKYRSYEMLFERVQKRLFEQYMYRDDVLAPQQREYVEKAAELLRRESILLDYKKTDSLRPHWSDRPETSQQYSPVDVPIGALYDAEGRPHVYGLYTYGDNTQKTASDIHKGLQSGTRQDVRFEDRKCVICQRTRREALEVDPAVVLNALSRRQRIVNFFRFYESRCPEGGLHDIVDGKCDKCGFIPAMSYTYDDRCPKGGAHVFDASMSCSECKQSAVNIYLGDVSDALKYFERYTAAYSRDLAENAVENVEDAPLAHPPEDLSRFAEQYAKYSYNFNAVLDLTGKLKLNPNLFTCLAATEQQEYTNVLNGVYIPNEPDTREDTRIFVLDAYIKMLIMDYNNLRYFYMFSRPPVDIARILDDVGYSKHEYHKLESKLPRIYGEYQERFRWFRHNKKPREIVEFLIETFAQKCLTLWEYDDESTRKLREAFVRYIVAKTVRIDELKSRAGEFNHALLFGDEREQDPTVGDSNYELTEEESTMDLDEDEENEDGSGDTIAPLKNYYDLDNIGETGEVDDQDDILESADIKYEGYEHLS